jgi:lipopolysaccharide/colanic/teichoic acid biosynthesis glycosyltransferase
MLPPPVVSELRSVRKVSNKSDFGSRPFTAAVGPQLSASTSSDATARALRFAPIIKRAFDIFVAAIGLVLFSPILLLSSLAIVVNSRGPIVCRQVRHAYSSEAFRILTFRCTGNENIEGGVQRTRRGARVTGIGRILQSSGLDGFPRLLNVLRGDMSIVGPAPYSALPGAIFEEHVSQMFNIKPGLTGWAQVNGYGDVSTSFEEMRRRMEYDFYYIENWSLLFDIKIILLALCAKKTYEITEQPGERRSN